MAYKKGKLKDSGGNVLLPKTSLDNILLDTTTSGSTTAIASGGKIKADCLGLSAGSGIDITEGTISATGASVTPGYGITTSGGTISAAPSTVDQVMSAYSAGVMTPVNFGGALTTGKAVDVTSPATTLQR